MRSKLLGSVAMVALLAGACGDDSNGDTETEDSETEDTAAETTVTTEPDDSNGEDTEPAPDDEALPSVDESIVQVVDSADYGPILADADGFTLYAFTEDSAGTSSCEEGCAEAWPPLTLDGADLPEAFDPEVYSVTERGDGETQLVAGDWPLYTYAADAAAGDTTGQGVGDSWFVVTPQGELVQEAGGEDDASAEDDGGSEQESDDY